MAKLLRAGSQLLGGGGGLATPVPAYGAELMVNGDFESWVTATNAATWSEGVAGASTVNRDAANQRAGTYCVRFDVDGSSSTANVNQGSSTLGTWYLVSIWAKLVSGTTSTIAIGKIGQTREPPALTASYVQYFSVVCASGTQGFVFGRGTGASVSIAMDDASCKAITLASMFSVKDYGLATADASAAVTIRAIGAPAGVVLRWTAADTWLAAWSDGVNCQLIQSLSGTLSTLKTGTPTYVAGAKVRATVNGTTAKLYYNGTQVSTDATINAALTGTQYGYFNSHAANTVSGLVVA